MSDNPHTRGSETSALCKMVQDGSSDLTAISIHLRKRSEALRAQVMREQSVLSQLNDWVAKCSDGFGEPV